MKFYIELKMNLYVQAILLCTLEEQEEKNQKNKKGTKKKEIKLSLFPDTGYPDFV